MDLQILFQKDQAFSGIKGLVFFDARRIIAYERDGNTDYYPFYLDLPGGGREPGETPFETFKRELLEEFGLPITADNITYAKIYHAHKDLGQQAFFVAAVLDKRLESKIHFGNEGTHYMVMDIDEFLLAPKAMPHHKDRIREYLEYRRLH